MSEEGRSRERIMARVRSAVSKLPKTPHPGALATSRAEDPVKAFAERFRASGGEVVTGPQGARSIPGRERASAPGSDAAAVGPGEWLTGFLAGLVPEVTGVTVGAEVADALRPSLPVVEARDAGAGAVVAWAAVAETGSLILPSQGGRAAQLLPPVLAVWVPAHKVFARLEDAFLALKTQGLPAAVGIHSGPSKSADIGGTVVTGVHGPGRCIAIVSE